MCENLQQGKTRRRGKVNAVYENMGQVRKKASTISNRHHVFRSREGTFCCAGAWTDARLRTLEVTDDARTGESARLKSEDRGGALGAIAR